MISSSETPRPTSRRRAVCDGFLVALLISVIACASDTTSPTQAESVSPSRQSPAGGKRSAPAGAFSPTQFRERLLRALETSKPTSAVAVPPRLEPVRMARATRLDSMTQTQRSEMVRRSVADTAVAVSAIRTDSASGGREKLMRRLQTIVVEARARKVLRMLGDYWSCCGFRPV